LPNARAKLKSLDILSPFSGLAKNSSAAEWTQMHISTETHIDRDTVNSWRPNSTIRMRGCWGALLVQGLHRFPVFQKREWRERATHGREQHTAGHSDRQRRGSFSPHFPFLGAPVHGFLCQWIQGQIGRRRDCVCVQSSNFSNRTLRTNSLD
jgi:hypothetical protein